MKHWKRILAIMLSVLLLATNIHTPTFASEDDMQYEDSEVKTESETNEETDSTELSSESTETTVEEQRLDSSEDDSDKVSLEDNIETQSLVEPSPAEYFTYEVIGTGEAKITSYQGWEKRVVVPTIIDGYAITCIGDYAFRSKDITEVILQPGITNIGEYAFAYDTGLTSVEIPESVVSIGTSAFIRCENLTNVILNEGLDSIGESAFEECSCLTNITIPKSVTSIGDGAFWGCKQLADNEGFVILNNCVYDYYGTDSAIIIPERVTSISERAFFENDNLTSITIPSDVTYIGAGAFFSCTNLVSISIPNGVTQIKDDTFRFCDSLTTVTVPDHLMSIGDKAFYVCGKLTDIDLPESVTEIGNQAFYACESLKAISIPNVTVIGESAFASCSLTSVTLSNDLTSISEHLFQSCDIKEIIIPQKVESIGWGAFSSCEDLESIVFPEGLKSIEMYTFSGCIGLTEIQLPKSLEYISQDAFSFCNNLNTVRMYDKVKEITEKAFDRCPNLKDVYYSGSEDQWSEIAIGKDNYDLLDATIHYAFGKGFDLKKDAHCVGNMEQGFSYDSHYTWKELIFGKDDKTGYKIPLERYQEVFGKSYTKQIYEQNIEPWGGNCLGMSATAAMFSLGMLSLSDYTDKKGTLAEVGYDRVMKIPFSSMAFLQLDYESELTKLIERYQIFQESYEFFEAENEFTTDYSPWSRAKVCSLILENSKSEKEPLLMIVGWNHPNKGHVAHALVIDSSKPPVELDNGWYRVYLYDPNNPYFGDFGNKTPMSSYLKAESRYVDIEPNLGDWKMTAATTSNGSNIDIGYADGNLISSEEIEIVSVKSFPRSFSKKATFKARGGVTSISFASNDFTVLDEAGNVLYQMVDGDVSFVDDSTVDEHYDIGYCEDEDIQISTGTLFLPEGEYAVEIDKGYVAYSSNNDYAGIVTHEPTIARNTSSTSLEIESESTTPVNVVIEDATDDEFISVSTNVVAQNDACSVSVENENMTIDSNTKQTIDIEIITENDEKRATDVEINAGTETALDLSQVPSSIENADLSEIPNQTYTGKEIEPEPRVVINGFELEKDVDFEYSYSNNVKAGTSTITIIGIGDYTGTKEVTFTILPKKVTPTVTLSPAAYTYNGKARKPSVTVKAGTKKLSTSDYTVTYAKGRKSVGKYKITVKLKGNYTGSKSVYFKINPKGTTLATSTAASKAITVKWKKQSAKMASSRITGYQIQLATNSKFTKNKKTVTVSGYSKTSKKVTKLKGKTKYYIRIRTYKTISGKKYYSPWSKAKTVTTKK